MAATSFGSINSAQLMEPRSPVANLVNNTGGTVDGVLEKVKLSLCLPEVVRACNNNFAEINAKLDEIIANLQKCAWSGR